MPISSRTGRIRAVAIALFTLAMAGAMPGASQSVEAQPVLPRASDKTGAVTSSATGVVACSDELLITVNGSGEQSSIVGPLMARVEKATLDAMAVDGRRTVRSYGLPYAAQDVKVMGTIGGVAMYLDSIDTGVQLLSSTLTLQALARVCPKQRFLLAGYSQGAIVIHQLLQRLALDDPAQLLGRIDGVALIADGSRVSRPGISMGTSNNSATGIVQNVAVPRGIWPLPLQFPELIPDLLKTRTVDVCDKNDVVCDATTLRSCAVALFDNCLADLIGRGVHETHYKPEATKAGQLLASYALGYPLARADTQNYTALVGADVGDAAVIEVLVAPESDLTWKVVAGDLPKGLKLKDGRLVGIPTTVGAYSARIRITTKRNHSPSEITVNVTTISDAAVTISSLPAAVLGKPYSVQLTSNMPTSKWRQEGTLPSGIRLSRAGELYGTAESLGDSTFDVIAESRQYKGVTARATLTLAVTSAGAPTTGTVWAWGEGDDGQLGNGAPYTSWVPVPVSGLVGITQVAGGNGTGYALKDDGTVWAWGTSTYGALGNSIGSSSQPVQVQGLSHVKAVTGAGLTAYALKSDGTVWAWGSNGYGALGNGIDTSHGSSTPTMVVGLAGVTAIAGGNNTGYALKSDGTVWAWGYGDYGALGDGTDTFYSTRPVRVSGLTSVSALAGAGATGFALKTDGTVWVWGWGGRETTGWADYAYLPVKVPGVGGVTAIAAGGDTGFALTGDGSVWVWGYNNHTSVGLNDLPVADGMTPKRVSGLTDAVAISGDTWNGYAVREDGSVWAWGSGSGGQLGNGALEDSEVPGSVSGLTGAFGVASGFSTTYYGNHAAYALIRTPASAARERQPALATSK